MWAQFDRRAHVAGGLGAIRAVCRAWQAFQTFLPLSTLEANPRVSTTDPGIGFRHTLSPCTHVRFGCKPGFLLVEDTRVHISLLLHRALRYDPAYQHQSIPQAAAAACNSYARAAAVVVGDYFDRNLRCSTRLYATTSRCSCFCCFCLVICRRQLEGSFKYHVGTQRVLEFIFMLVCFLYYTVPYQESTTLQPCRTAAAVGNTIYVRPQMTDSR